MLKNAAIPTLALGLATTFLGVLDFYQLRTIDRLRAELSTERDKETARMQETISALQLVQKYQNYLKEKGIPLP